MEILFQEVPRSKYQFFLLGIILKLAFLLAVSFDTFSAGSPFFSADKLN